MDEWLMINQGLKSMGDLNFVVFLLENMQTKMRIELEKMRKINFFDKMTL